MAVRKINTKGYSEFEENHAFALDYGRGKDGIVSYNPIYGTQSWESFDEFLDFMEKLIAETKVTYLVVVEASFCNFDETEINKDRWAVVERCKKLGIVLRCFPTKQTSKYCVEKTNQNDARAIWEGIFSDNPIRQHLIVPMPRKPLGTRDGRWDIDWAMPLEELLKKFPPVESLDNDARLVFCDKASNYRKYVEKFLRAFYHFAKGASRKQFKWQFGMYANAFPCYGRAVFIQRNMDKKREKLEVDPSRLDTSHSIFPVEGPTPPPLPRPKTVEEYMDQMKDDKEAKKAAKKAIEQIERDKRRAIWLAKEHIRMPWNRFTKVCLKMRRCINEPELIPVMYPPVPEDLKKKPKTFKIFEAESGAEVSAATE